MQLRSLPLNFSGSGSMRYTESLCASASNARSSNVDPRAAGPFGGAFGGPLLSGRPESKVAVVRCCIPHRPRCA